jgi:hypothetical protein
MKFDPDVFADALVFFFVGRNSDAYCASRNCGVRG